MSRVNGNQRFDAVRYSLSQIEGNWWRRFCQGGGSIATAFRLPSSLVHHPRPDGRF